MYKLQATLWTQLAFVQAEILSIDFYVYTVWAKTKPCIFRTIIFKIFVKICLHDSSVCSCYGNKQKSNYGNSKINLILRCIKLMSDTALTPKTVKVFEVPKLLKQDSKRSFSSPLQVNLFAFVFWNTWKHILFKQHCLGNLQVHFVLQIQTKLNRTEFVKSYIYKLKM